MSLNLTESDLVGVQRELASRSFHDFLAMGWRVLDPSMPYRPNWHMDCICEHLEALARGEINRLLFNIPPGTSKSSAVGVYFPAWLWGPHGRPDTRYIGASHEAGLATRDNRRTRLLIDSEWYQRRWPISISSDQNEKTYFENVYMGFRQSSAVKSMTGRRGHYVAWDDPINPEAANSPEQRETALRVFKETLPSRLVDPEKSAILVMMQRLHQSDVSGYILENDFGYTHVILPMEFEVNRRCHTVVRPRFMEAEPVEARFDRRTHQWITDLGQVDELRRAEVERERVQTVYPQDPRTEEGELLHPQRFSAAVVERDKRVMGEFATAGQFQQRPVPREGGLFKTSNIGIMDAPPALLRVCRGWDFAGTKAKKNASSTSGPAWTSGFLLGEYHTPLGMRYVILDVIRERVDAAGQQILIRATAERDSAQYPGSWASIPQDPGSAGKSWGTSIVTHCSGLDVRMSIESGDKETRAKPLAAQVNVGNVSMIQAPWNDTLIDEMGSFPGSKFKDQVDAGSRAFAELTQGKTFQWHVSGS